LKTQNHLYKPEIVTTADGSESVYVPALDENYHSHHGAIREAMHVFIDAGLNYVAAGSPNGIQVLEVGFGTGLNAFLTLMYAREREILVEYTGLEKYPLPPEFCEKLNYSMQISDSERWYHAIQFAPWQKMVEIDTRFQLLKLEQDLLTWKGLESTYHLIYFDAFGFRAQEELWQPEIFVQMFHVLRSGGILTTYASKGVVRRAMTAAGFIVTKLPGPPGKREMVRAQKPII
jgi:tRNA U34 5-methylaminomethyl-2-thiouridine-forming methyltransferase MnmC